MENQIPVTCAQENESMTEAATTESRSLRENFQIFGVATFFYSCFYVLCMYQNDAGITYPLFVAAGLLYVNYCRKYLKLSVKKRNSILCSMHAFTGDIYLLYG